MYFKTLEINNFFKHLYIACTVKVNTIIVKKYFKIKCIGFEYITIHYTIIKWSEMSNQQSAINSVK